jgi:phage terminase large subunit-like protein
LNAVAAPSALAEAIQEFAHGLRVPEGTLVGQPLLLMPMQTRFVVDTFRGGVRRAILSVARRNAKTATVAIIVLAALIGPLVIENAVIVSAARSRKQASVVFDYCRKMIRASGLSPYFKIKNAAKEIHCPMYGTTYQAMSAEAKTGVGFGVRICIHDELGRVEGPVDALFDALSTALGSYSDSLEIIISTQAPTDSDLLSVLIDDAIAANDDSTVVHLYTAPTDCELDDREAWAAANPAIAAGVRDLADVERLAREAKRLPSREASFRNFILNQRVRATEHYIPPALWDACAGLVSHEVFLRGPCFGGLDLSSKNDLTALAMVAADRNGVWHSRLWAWTPDETLDERARTDRTDYRLWVKQGFLETVPGSVIDYEWIAHRLGEIAEEYPFAAIQFDRWKIDQLTLQLDKQGIELPLVPHGQGYKDFSVAVDALEGVVLNRQLRHDGNPLLRWAMANVAIARDHAGNRKFDKRMKWRRIDPAVALAMAMRGAVSPHDTADVAGMIG